MIEQNKKKFVIKTSEYPIFLDKNGYKELENLIFEVGYSKVFVLVDSNTQNFCLSNFAKSIDKKINLEPIVIAQGEENKNLQSLEYILVELSNLGADRKSLLINLGGGVVTDIGGFAASIYKRGIDFVNIPTTLLSMVDASIGGKTGIDLHNLKNQIGTFSFPKMVLVDTSYLETLEDRELVSGFAEMLKHGLIASKTLWDDLKNLKPIENKKQMLGFVEDSILVKKEVVEQDPTEKGLRKILNFGHTLGHAVESFYLETKNKYLHGEAIAIGMICEAYLSKQKEFINQDELLEISNKMLETFPIKSIEKTNYKGILDYLKHDKKNKGIIIQYSLLEKLGKANYDIPCSLEEAEEALDFYNNFFQ